MNFQEPDPISAKINAAFDHDALRDPLSSVYHITLKNMLETLFLKRYDDECPYEEQLQRLIRNIIWQYREQILFSDVISPVIFSMCFRRFRTIVQTQNHFRIVRNLECMKLDYKKADPHLIEDTITKLFEILVYALSFFINKFDFDDYKQLNGGTAKFLFMISLEEHIKELWFDDLRHRNRTSRYNMEVNRIWHLLNDRYNHDGKFAYAYLALKNYVDESVYRHMIHDKIYAVEPNDYVRNYFPDPDPEEVQTIFREFHVL